MNIQLDLLGAAAQKVLSENAPLPMKMLGAKGVIPGASPPDALSVIVALASSADPKIAEAAQTTLNAPPKPLLDGALAAQLAVFVDGVRSRYGPYAV